jgi:hypothetical protein
VGRDMARTQDTCPELCGELTPQIEFTLRSLLSTSQVFEHMQDVLSGALSINTFKTAATSRFRDEADLTGRVVGTFPPRTLDSFPIAAKVTVGQK